MPLNIQEIRTMAAGSRLGRLWRWGRSPSAIAAVLKAPASLGNVEAAKELYPEPPTDQIDAYRLELLSNGRFYEELNRGFVLNRRRRTNCDGWNELLYLLVRLAKPSVIVETGVFDGVSSAVILQALEDSGSGSLVSIDLPAHSAIDGSTDRMVDSELPPGMAPGWAIPQYLRGRFRLIEGDSKEWLPQVLDEYRAIDIFFHDSLHTLSHQLFEYRTAWPHIKKGGLLVSDDIFFNSAFDLFCREVGKPYVHSEGFGALRK